MPPVVHQYGTLRSTAQWPASANSANQCSFSQPACLSRRRCSRLYLRRPRDLVVPLSRDEPVDPWQFLARGTPPRLLPRPAAVFFFRREGPPPAVSTETTCISSRWESPPLAGPMDAIGPQSLGLAAPRSREGGAAGHVQASAVILTHDPPPSGLPAKPRAQSSLKLIPSL